MTPSQAIFTPIFPPAMLGILGGGQLGMYFTLAAQKMGYHVTVLDPDPQSPAARFADVHLCDAFDSLTSLNTLATTCKAVTSEFENVSAKSLRHLAKRIAVHPNADCFAIAQDRIAEKQFFRDHGFDTAPFLPVVNTHALPTDLTPYLPGILKTARLGYDGKGQTHVNTAEDVLKAFANYQYPTCVLEKKLVLKTEISVTVVRSVKGEISSFTPAENQHTNGILDISLIPARISNHLQQKASDIAMTLAKALSYVGVLTVEFFVLADDTLVINEMAPRPHNSAHYTLDATLSSQFEQQVRMLCGLPPSKTTLMSPCVMVNLLGETWENNEPNWESILNQDNTKLYLYGKQKARPGRKMGHYTVLHANIDTALEQAIMIKKTL